MTKPELTLGDSFFAAEVLRGDALLKHVILGRTLFWGHDLDDRVWPFSNPSERLAWQQEDPANRRPAVCTNYHRAQAMRIRRAAEAASKETLPAYLQ